MVNKSQYGEREVKACKSVLLELAHLLGEIKDEVVIKRTTFPVLQESEGRRGRADKCQGKVILLKLFFGTAKVELKFINFVGIN